MISRTPMSARPRTANTRPRREIQALTRSTVARVRSGARKNPITGTSRIQSMMRLTATTSRTVVVVEPVDRDERREIRRARQGQQHADQERDARRALAQLALPPRRSLVLLGAAGPIAADHERRDQRERPQPDVGRRADRVLRRADRR